MSRFTKTQQAESKTNLAETLARQPGRRKIRPLGKPGAGVRDGHGLSPCRVHRPCRWHRIRIHSGMDVAPSLYACRSADLPS